MCWSSSPSTSSEVGPFSCLVADMIGIDMSSCNANSALIRAYGKGHPPSSHLLKRRITGGRHTYRKNSHYIQSHQCLLRLLFPSCFPDSFCPSRRNLCRFDSACTNLASPDCRDNDRQASRGRGQGQMLYDTSTHGWGMVF